MKSDGSAILQKAKRGYKKYEEFIKKFVYTDFYLLLVAVATFIGWVTQCAPFGIGALTLIVCLVLLGSDDILPITINIFGAALVIYTDDVGSLLSLWPILLPIIPCIIIFAIKNCRHKFRLGKMFYPQIAVSLALLLGGAGVVSSADYGRAASTAILLGLGVLAVYILYNHFLKRDGAHDIPTYFSKVMMYLGMVIALELVVVIIRSDIPVTDWKYSYWDVGWGNRNNIATYLILTAGLTFFLSTKYKHGWIYLAVGAFQYLCIILSFSRGGILFGGISGVIALVFAIVKSKNKKATLISVGVVLAVVLILYFAFMGKVNAIIASLLSRGMDTSGRTELYIEAWELFKSHPFLGGGLGYQGNNFEMSVVGMYWFHSTLFQVLGSMGLVGVAAYAYYYVTRAKLLFKNIKKTFILFILAIWIGFEGYCMIDAGTFLPYPNMMLVIVMTLLLELNTDCKPDDLYHSEYAADNGEAAAELTEQPEENSEQTAAECCGLSDENVLEQTVAELPEQAPTSCEAEISR